MADSLSTQRKPDFSNIPPAAAKELCRQGELCLQGTMQFGVAMDQRATTLTGILGASSAALLAVTASLSTSQFHTFALVASTAAMALVLYFGAMLCAWATGPSDFYVAGYEPRLLAKSGTQDTELWMQRYTAEDIQTRIDHNRHKLEKSAHYLTWGRADLLSLPFPLA